jgi:hypothetical protein
MQGLGRHVYRLPPEPRTLPAPVARDSEPRLRYDHFRARVSREERKARASAWSTRVGSALGVQVGRLFLAVAVLCTRWLPSSSRWRARGQTSRGEVEGQVPGGDAAKARLSVAWVSLENGAKNWKLSELTAEGTAPARWSGGHCTRPSARYRRRGRGTGTSIVGRRTSPWAEVEAELQQAAHGLDGSPEARTRYARIWVPEGRRPRPGGAHSTATVRSLPSMLGVNDNRA